jgi:3-oxoacyl-[acyl-carrier-protein] synthase III
MTAVGIHGVGVYLPDEVRSNEWWPASLVDQWREKKKGQNIPSHSRWVDKQGDGPDLPPLPGITRVVEALTALKDDPFQGSRERRVAPDTMVASDLEVLAAKDAIARAGIDKNEIGFVLSYSAVPDYLLTPNACRVHKQLGLPERCLSMAVEGACNTFALQLNLAEKLISSGQYRYGLLDSVRGWRSCRRRWAGCRGLRHRRSFASHRRRATQRRRDRCSWKALAR